MHLRTSVPLSLIFTALTGCARPRPPASAPPAAAPPRDDHRALIELERRWVASYVAADAGFLQQLFAADAVFINSRGQVSTGPQEIEELRSGAVRYRKFETWDVVPRIHGDAAFVTARSHIEGVFTQSQREFAVDVRVLDAFIRAGDAWKLVASQITRVEP
jgi:ketosteroid isomerase-like protein